MQWQCVSCGKESGPEAVYCPECGEPRPPEPESAGETTLIHRTDESGIRLAHSGAESRSTLIGSSAGIAPSLLDRGPDAALTQPLPRKVRISASGWVALVGGWPELSICMVIVPIVTAGVFFATRSLIGLAGAALVAGGLALSVIMALLFGAAETSRTLKGYRLLRTGWAAGGEITRKLHNRGKLGDTFSIEYTYLDGRGVHHRSRQEVSEDQWRELAERQPVTVLYQPDHPEECLVYELVGVVAVAPDQQRLPAVGEQ